MKHSYTIGCDCKRCTREAARRAAQSASIIPGCNHPDIAKRARRRKAEPKRPTPGSQEWAETRGDDLGYSGDY